MVEKAVQLKCLTEVSYYSFNLPYYICFFVCYYPVADAGGQQRWSYI